MRGFERINKLNKKFLDLKQNTPKRTQWLLLAAAFVVVLILLTLMVGNDDQPADKTNVDNITPELNIVPKSVAFTDIEAGSQKTETITITSNLPVKIVSVESEKTSGLSVSDTCTKMGQIDSQLDCTIMAKYAPDAAEQNKSIFITVKWYDAEQNEDMTKENKIKVDLSAIQSTSTILPFVEEEPEPEPEIIEETVVEEKPVQQEIKEEIETIAPAISFEPEPVEDSNEACSDFAFPGYDNSGQQIGWIKPEAGTYKFHPFSDKDCDSPTGIYNPDTGLIMSISNRGERIGSDAEHVGYNVVSSGILPELSNTPEKKSGNRARQLTREELAIEIAETSDGGMSVIGAAGEDNSIVKKGKQKVIYGTSGGVVDSTQPYDRSFVLRQFKPIPATIVSDVRDDAKVLQEGISLPVRATVDRNVYSDNGRTVILPTGTLMLGYVTGEIPGPYKTIGRMEIKWYQFIRPDGVEFNFKKEDDPFSGDAQGRVGVPGRGSSDYLEQFVMPMLTAIVPAAVNMIAPISDKFVNQIDLDNNTVVQSGTVRSSELAKNEIVTAWNQVAQKLLVDMMDNTVPPFTIAAGTRITVYSPKDLRVVCTDENKKCYVSTEDGNTGNKRRDWTGKVDVTVDKSDPSWTGQVRSFAISACCDEGKVKDGYEDDDQCNIYDYRTLLFYCQSSQYKAINNAKQEALWENQQSAENKNSIASKGNVGSQQYNEEVLGLTYDEETGAIQNPFNQPAAPADAVLTCEDGTPPDANGCCTGETYTDMGDAGFNCCPPDPNADCFPPLI
ncbi:MAG: hypothetical protein J6R99_02095 [Alphaproteobacteria bacterium]|nr:hypothetical protein [Alphaproteobacteria bacterium]